MKNKVLKPTVTPRESYCGTKLPEILNCYKCGSNDVEIDLLGMCKWDEAWVFCNSCGAEGPTEKDDSTDIAEVKAINSWNKLYNMAIDLEKH